LTAQIKPRAVLRNNLAGLTPQPSKSVEA